MSEGIGRVLDNEATKEEIYFTIKLRCDHEVHSARGVYAVALPKS
jgi:hypothetical protein